MLTTAPPLPASRIAATARFSANAYLQHASPSATSCKVQVAILTAAVQRWVGLVGFFLPVCVTAAAAVHNCILHL